MGNLHPATCADTPNIKTVDGNGALPPGIYNPTASRAACFCSQMTPGAVSMRIS